MPRNPLDASHGTQDWEGSPGTQAASQLGLGKSEEAAVEHNYKRHVAMDAAADMLNCGRRLTVDDVVRALSVEPNELGVRLAKPDRVVLMPRRVDEQVPSSINTFLPLAVRVPGRDDVYLVPPTYKPSCEVARVILHPSNAVLWDDEGNDADPHSRLVHRARKRDASTKQ
jgi:hypothetical protein